MKRYILTLLAAICVSTAANALDYETAREEAMYLTDKMAYELNLNEEQYEYAYEINLDYLMGLNTYNDIEGIYLTHRNADMRCILHDWQWTLFTTTKYFFRPVYWRYGSWYYPIYSYYSRGYYYYDRPRWYYSYRGAHCHDHFRNGWYTNRRPSWNGGFRGHNREFVGRSDRHNGRHSGYGNSRDSYRTHENDRYGSRQDNTDRRGGHSGLSVSENGVTYGNGNNHSSNGRERNGSMGDNRRTGTATSGMSSSTRQSVGGSYDRPTRSTSGNTRSSYRGGTPSRSYSGSSAPSRSYSGGSTSSRSFSAPSRSSMGGGSTRGSMGGGSSHGGRGGRGSR